jgi:chitinase
MATHGVQRSIQRNADQASSRLIGYFPSWGIHAMKYNVADIPADNLNCVIYAFAGVSADNECVSGKVADDHVNFPQLVQLKQQYPNLRTLISVGGASHSTNFPNAASSDATRQHFAQSCVQFMKQNGFDGIDIDWEYPTAGQKQSFTALLGELRRQLNAEGAADGQDYLLTIAAPAGPHNYANLELNLIPTLLDWINLMTYDFAVASSKRTDFVAPLNAYDPAIAKHATGNVAAAVQAYLNAGVPNDKLVLGTRFVGTGWQGVPGVANGLYQDNDGPAQGSWDAAGAAPSGSFGYQDLEQNYLGSYTRYWHSDAQVPWLYSPDIGIFVSYEDPQSLQLKAAYVVQNRLGGVMIWQLAADDEQHSLVNALASVLLNP